MKISVLTPTIRPKGLEIVAKSLQRQTFEGFEWLIGSKFMPIEITAQPSISPFSRGYVKDDFKGGFWTLNRIYNKLIKEAKGELIVSWQDYTFAKPDALEKFWAHYQLQPKVIVSGVGNKYADSQWTEVTWEDPRKRQDQGSFYQCYFNDIEGNYCAVSKKALYDIGGFDEQLDFLGFGMDWYGVFNRIYELGTGYDFCLDQTNESFSLGHSRVAGEKKWEKNNLIHGGYRKRREELKKKGKWPKLDYLNGNPS